MTLTSQELHNYFEAPPADICLSDIDLARLPHHISIIMDGNGRWATKRGLHRSQGHIAGVSSLREVVTASVKLGLEVLSAYAFSTENWHRPQKEVDLLMHLFATTLLEELPLFHQENVQLRFFGDIDSLPSETSSIFKEGLLQTKDNNGMIFALAVNYGSRSEIVRAVKACIKDVCDGTLTLEEIDERYFSEHLYTKGLPDPDLLIRSSGELRLSNYLLYQLAYSEFYITDTLWPDFSRWDLLRAIKSFQARKRRFGGITPDE